MKVCCLSDTHHFYDELKIPECDILIHAGDLQAYNKKELKYFCKWIDSQNANYKIVIAGNHDKYIAESNEKAKKILNEHCIYLENSSYTINNIKIYGSPITPIFGKWYFMLEDNTRKKVFDAIPNDIDILVTHGPPLNILDRVSRGTSLHVGDILLNETIRNCSNLKYHIFGHIHEGYGSIEYDSVKFINCSICDELYNVINKPVIINI